MSVDVLLAYLPVKYGGGRSFGLPPLGVYYLASALTAEGLSVRVLDASIKGLSLAETVREIEAANPALVGLSIMTPHLKSAKALVDTLNDKGFAGRVCLGGAHINATGAEVMDFIDVDFAFKGESERAFAAFARTFVDGGDWHDTSNLIWRADGTVRVNPERDFEKELDALPFPDLSLGDPSDYEIVYGKYDRATTLMASRGCPYLCTFCDVFAAWGRQLRLRSPKNIVDEIEFNRDRHNIREFVFKDSTFTLNHKWMDRFLTEMERRAPGVSWHCNSRVDRVDEPMLRRMKGVGLRSISYGVESGDQDILNAIKKNIKVEDVRRVFAMTDRLGIQATAFFMVGHIGETEETAARTLDLALSLKATYASFAPNTAYPGTEDYENAVREGYLRDSKWYLSDIQSDRESEQFLSIAADVSNGQPHLPDFPPERQVSMARHMSGRFYFRPSTVYRVLFRNSSFRLFWRATRFAPKLFKFSFGRLPDDVGTGPSNLNIAYVRSKDSSTSQG